MVQRPRVDISEKRRAEVEQYAQDKGVTMPRAYAELIRIGLTNAPPGERDD